MKRVLLCLTLLLSLLTEMTGQTYTQLTDVASLYIETKNRQAINSKTQYIDCKLVLVDGPQVITYDSVQIRGRGNSTWYNSDKKPYRIKFAKKQHFLGEGFANAKSWTLIANHGDKTMMRNALTYDLGRFVGMPFCPAARFVDLYLNGNYRGTYQISDQVQVHKKRVEVDKTTGWFIEVGNEYSREEPYFTTALGIIYNIKNPDDENYNASVRQSILTWIQRLENVILSSSYKDPDKGYRAYIDEKDLINWYVAAEITGNIDALFSIYMYKEADEDKIHYGPLWDLDLGYDNSSEKSLLRNMEAYLYLSNRPYEKIIRRLWEDPWFAKACNERIHQLVDDGLQDYLISHIDSLRNVLYQTQAKNFCLWKINQQVYSWEKHKYHNTYDEYVDDLKAFVNTHISYLVYEFDRKYATGITPIETNGTTPDATYDLGGRRIRQPGHGVYIQNGKKVVR